MRKLTFTIYPIDIIKWFLLFLIPLSLLLSIGLYSLFSNVPGNCDYEKAWADAGMISERDGIVRVLNVGSFVIVFVCDWQELSDDSPLY